MNSWKDPERWEALLQGRECPLCDRRSRPGVVAELASCLVTVDESISARGYCCLVLKRHAVELHQLSAADAAAFIGDVQLVAGAVQGLTGAIKLNYEVYGNVVPHLHLHIVPRYPGDAIEISGQGFASAPGPVYGAGEFEWFAGQLQRTLVRE